MFGKAMADFIDRGITGLPGSPIDVSGRMSMANLIPGTGLLLEKRDHSRDAQEVLGPVGDMAKRAFEGTNAVLDGDIKRALLSIAPKPSAMQRRALTCRKGVTMLMPRATRF